MFVSFKQQVYQKNGAGPIPQGHYASGVWTIGLQYLVAVDVFANALPACRIYFSIGYLSPVRTENFKINSNCL